MSAGIKQYKPIQNLGIKSYKPSLSLGMKTYTQNHNHTGDSPNGHTHDGIIYNTSNSADVQREPMKHNNFKPKDYTKNIIHSSIEKARKKKPNENNDKKFT
jgi:hypothetical protein